MKETTSILLDCLNLRDDPARAGRLGQVAAGDWAAVLAQADLQRVTPWLYARLQSLGVPLPAQIAAALQQTHRQNYRRNQVLYLEMGKVLRVLRAREIQAIAFKGLHLAGEVYHDMGARWIGDIDLLVHAADLERIETEMLGLGCQSRYHNRIAGPAIYDFTYILPKTEIPVEFHWALNEAEYAFTPDIAGIWQRSQETHLAGTALRVMAAEDLLLYLCLHTAKHWYELRLKMLCDLAAVTQRYEQQLDWPAITQRARQWGITHCVYLLLSLAGELLAAPLPAGVLERLRPADFQEQYRALALEQFLAAPDESQGNQAGQAKQNEVLASSFALVEMAGAQGAGNKLKVLWRRFFLPRQTMALFYPAPAHSWRIYPYYLVRIKDLLQRFGGDAWKMLRGSPEKRKLVERSRRARELQAWLKSVE
jgi:hypothetical protein